jgi:hypothetical protein
MAILFSSNTNERKKEMNYYLIWTDKGWIKTPVYHHAMCSDTGFIESSISTTYDINHAYRFDEKQTGECFSFLLYHGVPSWIMESKEDMNIKHSLSESKK